MKKRVLVIDDEYAIRESFRMALENTQYTVTACENGLLGIEAITRDHYDLVYLDLKMPGINGVETLKRIRAHDPEVPIYIVTAYYEDFRDELSRAGMQALNFEVLIKPLDSRQIVEITSSILEGPRLLSSE